MRGMRYDEQLKAWVLKGPQWEEPGYAERCRARWLEEQRTLNRSLRRLLVAKVLLLALALIALVLWLAP